MRPASPSVVLPTPTPDPAPAEADQPLRVLELYCGIGGAAVAVGPEAKIVGAFDVSDLALEVYRTAHDHPAVCVGLESLTASRFAAAEADLWWLSPPCQPFTRRGLGRDDTDPRSRSLLSLIPKIVDIRPRFLALENVPGFADSRTRDRLLAALTDAEYSLDEAILCPTEFGVPMRRRRYYLLASTPDARIVPRANGGIGAEVDRPLSTVVDPAFDDHPALRVETDLARAYRGALDMVSADDPNACCACFTSAYGRSPVRSGSYLRRADGAIRRFHPQEILRLLGFGNEFVLPAGLDCRRAWRLVGNSLSVDVVRYWLSAAAS